MASHQTAGLRCGACQDAKVSQHEFVTWARSNQTSAEILTQFKGYQRAFNESKRGMDVDLSYEPCDCGP